MKTTHTLFYSALIVITLAILGKTPADEPKPADPESQPAKPTRTKVVAETSTPKELILLEGVSNERYHDLSAAKILAPIGQAFAEALGELRPLSQCES